MRSTPARALHQDQLLVDRYAVHKINKVEYPLPQNTVTVDLTNQLTGEQSTRNLRWDEQVTVEGPLQFSVGDTGKITIELAQLSDSEDRAVYRWHLTDKEVDFEAADLYLGPRLRPDNRWAAKTLLSDLRASGEAWAAGHELEADSFPEDVNVWAANHDAEIDMAQIGLSEGLERS